MGVVIPCLMTLVVFLSFTPGIQMDQAEIIQMDQAEVNSIQLGHKIERGKTKDQITQDNGLNVMFHSNGSYSIMANGQIWLNSGPFFVYSDNRSYTTEDGSMKVLDPAKQTSGQDSLGKYNATSLIFGFANSQQKMVKIQMTAKIYAENEMLIFSQTFLDAVKNTSIKNAEKVMCGFPTVKTSSPLDLGMLAYVGTFFKEEDVIGRFSDNMPQLKGGMQSGPIVLFDQTSNAMVISPFSQFMTTSLTHDKQNRVLNWGLPGTVNEIPAGFNYEVSIYYSNKGINKAMEGWGKIVRKYYKKDADFRYQDPSIKYVGYYTDNGAYYYHKTEEGMNYEETLLSIYKEAKQRWIPYRYIQYDDWWYPISHAGGDGYGSTITWETMPSVFPHGMQYLYNITRWPVVAHNRYWSALTSYAKQNGGPYEFYVQEKHNISLPLEQRFWNDLFAKAVQWGLIVYEQDWLTAQIENIDPLNANLYLGHQWLMQMGEAASRYGLRVQYCMASPRHALQALQIPSVTQIRASIDYLLRANQWDIGVSSMLADAVGLAPFKDNFWTVSNETGNPYGKSEPCPLLKAAVSLISTGPVGPSDRLGLANATLIKKLVRDDGLLLKPSKPATAIDAQIIQAAYGGSLNGSGKVSTTYSDIGPFRFGILLAADFSTNQSFRIDPSSAGWDDKFMDSLLYSYKSTTGDVLKPISRSQPLLLDASCSLVDFCLYYTTPVIMWNSVPISILGEMDKLVPVSPQRLLDIEISALDMRLTLGGSPGESVTFSVYVKASWQQYKCTMSAAGQSVISVAHNTCY